MQSDFVDLVKQMRAAQKLYFLRRNATELMIAKALEARVDEAVAKLWKAPDDKSQQELEIF